MYSCAGTGQSNDLYKADPLTGNLIASYNVAGGLGTLAWDGKRKKIWAGWGAGAGSDGDVLLIDPATGSGSVVFNATAAAFINIDDGLAYDFQDDSLYVSPDTSTTIYHYSIAGAPLGSFVWAGSGCFNSGLAIGGELLFQGSDGCNHIWVIKRSDHTPVFDFNTGAAGVRDEGMTCDSVTFSPKTVIWSIEAYEPRRAVAFEIPPGTCATGGGVDTDGDGLLDEWEVKGITIDGGAGPQFINLPAMGADSNKPDIYLQIDWMQDATHNQKLSPAVLKIVVDAFANSPYLSPTASLGINLHIDEGPDSILNYATGATWGALSKAHAIPYVDNLGTITGGSYDWTAFQTIKDAPGGFTQSGRTPIFHYIIAAHNYGGTTSSGISRGIEASDLIVSLGSFTGGVGSNNEQAGTLMHELGHNLGLHHGGSDDVNYKPNYLSIMSYAFQMQGLISGGAAANFDYSRSALGSLNKASLNEPAGLGASAAGYGTRHYCSVTGTYVPVVNAVASVDWNCNGVSTDAGVAYDINNDGSTADTLTGVNDWANLKLKGGAIGLAGIIPVLPTTTVADLLTKEEASKVILLPGNPNLLYLPIVN